LRNEEATFSKGQTVESIYAFDIHCNAFVPFYFFTNILQFFCLPVIFKEGYLGTVISNILFTVGILYYFYVTMLCYYCTYKLFHVLFKYYIGIPFIKKNKYILLAICKYYLYYIQGLSLDYSLFLRFSTSIQAN